MKKIITTFFICSIVISGLSQSYDSSQNKKSIFYDDWPVTVKSNASATQIYKDGTTKFIPIGTKWDHRIITYFFQNGTNDIVGNNEQQAIRDGFSLWSAQTNLYFLEVCSADNADIVFLWGTFNHGDEGPFDGEGGILAHTLGGPPPNEFGDRAGDIHFDDSETWTLNVRNNNAQPIDLITVAAHEIGHALGLNHTTVTGSLMLANYTGSHRFLGSDDIAGIQNLYGVVQTSNIPISGPFTVCSYGATFGISNLPPVDSIIWGAGPYLTVYSGQNTNSPIIKATGNGSSWVQARLVTACGSITLPRKEVWAGVPDFPVLSLVTPSYVSIGSHHSVSVESPGADPALTTWSTSGCVTLVNVSGNYASFMSCPIDGCGSVYVSSANLCGCTNNSVLFVVSGNGGDCLLPESAKNFSLVIFPNPATGETTLTIEPGSGEKSLSETAEWELEIYTQTQLLKEKKTRLKGRSVKIQTAGWQEGVYLARAIYNGQVVTGKLVVKR